MRRTYCVSNTIASDLLLNKKRVYIIYKLINVWFMYALNPAGRLCLLQHQKSGCMCACAIINAIIRCK